MFEGLPKYETDVSAEQQREAVFAEFSHTTLNGYKNFKARAEKTAGHIRISVHPFFAERFPATTTSLLAKDTLPDAFEHMREGFTRTVTSVATRPDSSPLIIFEEGRGMQQTKELLKETIAEKENALISDILIIETATGSGMWSDSAIAKNFDILYPETSPSYTETLQRYADLRSQKLRDVKERMTLHSSDDWSVPITPEERSAYQQALIQHEEKYQSLDNLSAVLLSYRQKFIEDFVTDSGIKSVLAQGSYISGDENKVSMCLGAIVQQFRNMDIPVDISKYVLPYRDELKADKVITKQTNKTIE